MLHCVISCLHLQSNTLVWNPSGPHSHQWVFKCGRVLFYSGKTKSTLPSNTRQNEITFIKTGTTRKKVQVIKQLGTINFWPKKKITTLLISIRDQTFRAAVILLLICAAGPRIFILEGREIRELEQEPEPIIILIGVVFFIHFISNSWLAIQTTRMYKVSEYYCSNHTILSWMTNQLSNQTSVNTHM